MISDKDIINCFLGESNNLVWVIDTKFNLIYANQAYLNLMKEVTGVTKKLNESIFVEGFGDGYIEKWKAYYEKGLSGDMFELEEHFYHPETNEIHYSHISFQPIKNDEQNIVGLACASRDISKLVKNHHAANQLLDSSLDVFCTINEQGNFIYVNNAAITHWGYRPEELLGKPYMSMVMEEDILITNNIAVAIIAGENIKSFINRYKKKDGSIAYNLWSARWDPASKLMYCVARDAKETQERQQMLQQSEERFKALVQGGADLIAILDAQGNYNYVSPTIDTILGIQPEIFLNRNAFEFIHPDDVERTMQFFEKISIEKTVKVEPFRFQNHKGEWRWIETVLTNMLDNPAVNGIVANSRDITEKIKEEHQRKLLESVITHTNDAVLITEAEPFDEPGPRIIYVNEAFTKMTGYTAEEVLGKTPRILQGPNSDKEELSKLGGALRNWESYEIATINYKKSGEEFWVHFTVTPVADETGWYTHWIAIERDITEQKNAELEKILMTQVAICFREGELPQASHELCKVIRDFGDFDLIELWCLNLEQTNLIRIAVDTDLVAFDTHHNPISQFSKNEGLPGKVWKEQKQLIWDQEKIKQLFLRKDAAETAGLRNLMGVPLTHHHQMIGVLVIGTKQNTSHLNKFSGLIQKLESFIGSEINRKKLEDDLKHLYQTIPDILCIADFKGRFLKMNPAGCQLLGYEEKEILFHCFDEFVHPEDKDISTNEVKRLEQGATTFKFENRYITKSGEIIWLSWSCNSVIQDGLIYAAAKNITEEKKLQVLNQQSNILAKIGSWEVDFENNKIFWSEMVHQLHETDPNSFIPDLEKAIYFYREDFRPKVIELINKSIHEGSDFDFEAVIVTTNNRERWVRSIGKVERLNGITKRIFGSFQDISGIKETEFRLQSLSNNLPGVVFQYYRFADGGDELRNVSDGAMQIWGFSAEEAMRNNQQIWKQLEKGGNIEEHKKSIELSIRTKSLWKHKWKYIMPNNESRTHLGYGIPTFFVDGTVVFNSVILDVTEEAKKEELLDQTTQMARIGSWELDLVNQDGDTMYWSPMTKAILECDDAYNPSLTGSFEFYTEESKKHIQEAVDLLIREAIDFDLELLLVTAKGNERWVRCIGQSERVDGQCIKIYGSFQDIHASKSLELQISEILRSISDAFYAVDDQWNFTYFNKEAERLLQKKAAEVLGQNIWQLFPAAVGTDLEHMCKQVIATNEAHSFEYLFPGDHQWYEVNAYPSKGGVSVYFKNITERKQTAQALQEAFEERDNILESIGDAFFALDKDWVVTYWNKQATNLIGFPKEEIIGKNIWEVFPDAIDSDFYRKYHYAMKNGEIIRFESKYETSGKWFEVNVYPSVTGLSVYLTDVTLRKEVDERLIQANERFEKVAEATNDAIWDWDIEKNTLYWGGGYKALFGHDSYDISSNLQSWADRIHPDDVERVTNSLNASINSGQTYWSEEYRYMKHNGTFAYVVDRGVAIRDSSGKVNRMVGAITDISERRLHEEELESINQTLEAKTYALQRSNEELEQFAFVASHDLQEPLRMISSFMDLLHRKYEKDLDDKALQYIKFAIDGSKRMKQIILDLLDFSRSSRATEEKENIDLNEILLDYKQLRRKIIQESGASIQTVELPVLHTHRTQITQILHSLLDNAIKYVRKGEIPEILLDVKSNEAEWVFSVKDNGIGIDPQFYDKIFIIFQRLHNRDEYSGTGIGLSIVKRSVEFLGGKVWLESVLDVGTTFYFTIPKE